MRTTWTYWSTPRRRRLPHAGAPRIDGPKCILVNEYAGSGGDALPVLLPPARLRPDHRQAHLGRAGGHQPRHPAGGRRRGDHARLRHVGSGDGQWMVENHGVDPDIEVENTPERDGARAATRSSSGRSSTRSSSSQKNPPRRPARPTVQGAGGAEEVARRSRLTRRDPVRPAGVPCAARAALRSDARRRGRPRRRSPAAPPGSRSSSGTPARPARPSGRAARRRRPAAGAAPRSRAPARPPARAAP